ncbi:fimbrial protein [Atlantibacter sp.]|uniref:fimbrial protein n=1 Tax=Atlantibacter sp. TaxID=1903473 RepID=UPI0028AE9273|nr:fimbrial protein [Atlantibacter sp.]
MKKIGLVIAASGLFLSGAALATDNDLSATLAITGDVHSNANCTVELDRSTMNLGRHDISTLPTQGHYEADIATTNVARLVGDGCLSKTGSDLALKFIGMADAEQGNAFTNSVTGSAAAQGIGIGVYGANGAVISPNTSTVIALNKQYLFSAGMVKMNNSTPAPGLVHSSITVQIERL